jgi:hypothetical protein
VKIFDTGLPIDQYKDFIWRRGDRFLLKLHGINFNLQARDLYVEPVYLPLFQYQKDGGQMILDVRLGWTEDCWTIILMQVFPYVWIGHSKHIRLDPLDEET